MATVDQAWPTEALDAISIWAPRSQINIVGTDENQVRLRASDDGWYPQVVQPGAASRWLLFHYWDDHASPSQLTLMVPKNKAWVLELSAWKGNLDIRDVQARLMIANQKGDIHVSGCRGIAMVKTGDGNVEIDGWTEQEMPERPPMPPEQSGFQTPGVDQTEFRIPGPQEWFEWSPQEWTNWGTQFGGQARMWAQQFEHFWNLAGWQWPRSGLSLYAGKSDVRLRRIDARSCTVHTSKGNIRMEDNVIASLRISTHHGDIEVASTYPTEAWELKNSHGNIRLSLPADAQVRLDAATREGDVHSEVPLVRVARPGPESRRGGRMVGTLGAAETAKAQVSLETMHGDIEIFLRSGGRRAPTASQPVQTWAVPPAAPPAPAVPIVPPAPVSPVTPEPPVEPSFVEVPTAQGIVDLAHQEIQEAGPSVPQEAPAAEAAPAPQDPVMAILQALSEGTISVEEADRLLERQLSAGQGRAG
jgi:hypothetical protein